MRTVAITQMTRLAAATFVCFCDGMMFDDPGEDECLVNGGDGCGLSLAQLRAVRHSTRAAPQAAETPVLEILHGTGEVAPSMSLSLGLHKVPHAAKYELVGKGYCYPWSNDLPKTVTFGALISEENGDKECEVRCTADPRCAGYQYHAGSALTAQCLRFSKACSEEELQDTHAPWTTFKKIGFSAGAGLANFHMNVAREGDASARSHQELAAARVHHSEQMRHVMDEDSVHHVAYDETLPEKEQLTKAKHSESKTKLNAERLERLHERHFAKLAADNMLAMQGKFGWQHVRRTWSSKIVKTYGHPDWLKKCRKIFLDVGSFKGVNVRKLFEPARYKNSPLLAQFDAHFGTSGWRRGRFANTGVCALGLEPNPAHFDRLQILEDQYAKFGWHTHFYPFAAWTAEGFMDFNVSDISGDGTKVSPNEPLSARLTNMQASPSPKRGEGQVRVVDLAQFVRSLPKGSLELIVMDIEGSEYETLAELVRTDTLCKKFVKHVAVATHSWGSVEHWGDSDSFVNTSLHPRTWPAVADRIAALNQTAWCTETADEVSEVDELGDHQYAFDIGGDWMEHLMQQA